MSIRCGVGKHHRVIVFNEVHMGKKNKVKGITIPFEAADHITVANLKDHRKIVKKMLDEHYDGKYMHPLDEEQYKKTIESIDEIVKYFGEQ